MRLCQILRSLDAESSGVPIADEFVTISRAELDELRARAGAGLTPGEARDVLDDEPDEPAEASRAASALVFAASQEKAAELERSYKSALRDRELAMTLIGKPLVAGAAAQLIKLSRKDFEVIDDGGELRVVARDGRAVDRAIADRLAGPEFAHFCLPPSRGGTGARGQNRSATPAPPAAAPRTLGEAVVMQWREAARSEAPPGPAGWGRRRR